MPPTPLTLRPGINTESTPALNAAGWSAARNIRFFQSLVQKAGGFTKLCQVPANPADPQQGRSAVALRAWATLAGALDLAIAGENRLSLFTGDTVYDITPNTISALVPIDLSTTTGSATVTVFDPVDHPSAGEWVRFRAPIAVGGVIIDGSYEVVTVVDPTHYTVTAANNAASTVASGGVARQFTTTAGSATVTVAFAGHGLAPSEVTRITDPVVVGGLTLEGNYVATVIDPNTYTITAAAKATGNASVYENGNNLALNFWNPATGGTQNNLEVEATALDNWGEFLVAIPQGGPVYVWQPADGPTAPAAPVDTAPLSSTYGFVAQQQQILVLLGTVNLATGLFDPLLVRWSDIGDYTQFTPLSTNQAGSFRLQMGSAIVAGLAVAGRNLIWTDLGLYSMQYLSTPLVFGFQPIGVNCGLVGPLAFGTLGGAAFWMSRNQFYVLPIGGSPQIMPCTVWDQVFKNLDLAYLRESLCGTNAAFNEVSWWVRQKDGTTTKATVQLDTGEWTYTTIALGEATARSAWIDQNVFGPPLGASPGGSVYREETGTDADSDVLPASILSGIAQLAEGDEFVQLSHIRPDIKFSNQQGIGPGTVEMLVYLYSDMQASPNVKGPYPVSARTRSIPCRGRARGIQLEFRSRDLGSWWRLGRVEYEGFADGKGG